MKKLLFLFLLLAVLPVSAYAAENDAVTRLGAVHMLQTILPTHEAGVPFADTADPAVAYYGKLGIVHAIEENNFHPDQPMSTQEFLIMLKRTLDKACPDLFYDNQAIQWHYDQNEIAPAYQSQIAFLSAVGVYNNSGYLKPTAIISEGMASYYLSLAVHAQNYGTRSKNGQMSWRKPDFLMYHVIDQPREPFPYVYVTAEHFEEQIRYFYNNGYTFLFPEELALADRYQKSVVITFDDGYDSVYTRALPILKKYNAKATLFMISSLVGTPGYCTEAELFEMSDSGAFRIGSHTDTHPRLTDLSAEEIAREFAVSNDRLYNITKREVTSLAYPYGFFNDTVLSQARRYYKTAFSVTNPGNGSVFEIPRTSIDNEITLAGFPKYLR